MCKEYPETCHHGCWHLSDISSLISLSIISPCLICYHWYQVTWNQAGCYGFLKKLSFRLVHGVPFLCPYLSHLLGLVLGWATRCSETTWENLCQVGYLLLSGPTLVWTMQGTTGQSLLTEHAIFPFRSLSSPNSFPLLEHPVNLCILDRFASPQPLASQHQGLPPRFQNAMLSWIVFSKSKFILRYSTGLLILFVLAILNDFSKNDNHV